GGCNAGHMFEAVEEPIVPSGKTRAAAVARLASISRDFRRPVEGGMRRAKRLAPGVYRAPALPPCGSIPVPVGHERPAPAADLGRAVGDAWEPGPMSAAALNRMPAGALSSRELLDGVAGWEQLISWAQARQCELVAEFARRRPGPYEPDEPEPGRRVSEFAADEIAARLRVSRRAAEMKLSLALALADRLPGTADALRKGQIDVGKAKAIAELTANVAAADARAAVEDHVLRRAGDQTGPELRRSLLRAVARVDPMASVKRHQRAEADRFLRVQPCCDGMAELTGWLSAEDAMIVFGAVDSLARSADADDSRSIDARRVDALVDLCRPTDGPSAVGFGDASPAAEGNRASLPVRRRDRGGPDIRVVVRVGTLLGLDDQPAELVGYGPVDAETARRIAADPDATWRRLLTDPVSGTLLDYGTRVYRPPESLARHVKARDQVCCFPGCRQPAARCDLDHGVPYPHGPTCEANLIPLCRHHHRAKTHGGWRWRRDDDGTVIWTAPTGHEYQVPVPPVLDDPPPF
ncbi:MAG TPA: DUF222 domain-containing protein, partial [Jiangellaceae bacterium]|nr:DUF222 domain-containing protein [Jiangellaceae bacterium]